MTRRTITRGPPPHTSIAIRSRRGTRPAWVRTLLLAESPDQAALACAFVGSANGDVTGIDAWMDTLEASDG